MTESFDATVTRQSQDVAPIHALPITKTPRTDRRGGPTTPRTRHPEGGWTTTKARHPEGGWTTPMDRHPEGGWTNTKTGHTQEDRPHLWLGTHRADDH